MLGNVALRAKKLARMAVAVEIDILRFVKNELLDNINSVYWMNSTLLLSGSSISNEYPQSYFSSPL